MLNNYKINVMYEHFKFRIFILSILNQMKNKLLIFFSLNFKPNNKIAKHSKSNFWLEENFGLG
jgi:hypothetical protein